MEELNKEVVVSATNGEHAAAVGTANGTACENAGSDKKYYAFGKMNFILMAVSMLIVIAGFVLMSGSSSDETVFDADIFSVMRIKVAPVVCFVGFVSMIFAIVYKQGDKEE